MKMISSLACYALGVYAAVFTLVGCGEPAQPANPVARAQIDPSIPGQSMPRPTVRYATCPCFQVLHSFSGGSSDGARPLAGLAFDRRKLYGTTADGGTFGYFPGGTVFSITPGGTEKVIANFNDDKDGFSPESRLDVVNGVLYGTTLYGPGNGCAGSGCGTVFRVTRSGQITRLYAFSGGNDGYAPVAGLRTLHGLLYGTTLRGGGAGCGVEGCGTVFSITTTGTEQVLHRFSGGTDGIYPSARLRVLNGVLYGTTADGGGTGCGGGGCGTVFSVTTSGTLTVLYSFSGGSDGVYPAGDLRALHGVLYGTTAYGAGTGCFNNLGCGTVFSITPCSTPPCPESVLHRFSGSDGADPWGGLTEMNGVLYATTLEGGGTGCSCGTVFSITTSGTFTVLHKFIGSDGSYPYGDLRALHGVLYGTTNEGGGTGCFGGSGCGTVFSLTP
jgi:uncharacterized repeat protein (TIGR03803 family)